MDALKHTANRQAVWSRTASTLKAVLDRTRWTVFGLSIAGALLATIAAQSHANTRWWFAMIAAAALATGTFLTTRLMGGAHVSDWVRARAAAEALKGEAYKCAANASPYDGDQPSRVAKLNEEREKIEDAVVDLIDKEVRPPSSGSAPTGDITPDEYIERRVRGQADGFYERKADAYRRLTTFLGWIEFSLALVATIITAVIGAADKEKLGGFDYVGLAAVFTTISGAIVAHVESSRYRFLVTTYRATARRLNNELARIAQPFAAPSSEWSDFVSRCEMILAEENGGWLAKWTK